MANLRAGELRALLESNNIDYHDATSVEELRDLCAAMSLLPTDDEETIPAGDMDTGGQKGKLSPRENVAGLQEQLPFTCVAVHDYSGGDGEDGDTLVFSKGDKVEVVEIGESGWWSGSCKDLRGWFPEAFVALPAEVVQALQTGDEPEAEPTSDVEDGDEIEIMVCLYYNAFNVIGQLFYCLCRVIWIMRVTLCKLLIMNDL